jgi:hypothetical protein
MGRRQGEVKILRRRLLVLGAWPLMIALLSGCSSVGRPAESAAVSVDPGSLTDTQLATASAQIQPGTDFARDRIAEDSTNSHQPNRRTCWKAIHDAFTKPWYGNYLGPDNFGYDKQPIDELDAAAREHDMAYDHCHAAGIGGALLCVSAGKADLQLARRAFLALPSLDFGGRLMGVGTGIAMGVIGIVKVPVAELRDAIHHRSESTVATPTS